MEYDILKIEDDKETSKYIKINLNQVYNVQIFEKGITIFLDNDTKIKISI